MNLVQIVGHVIARGERHRGGAGGAHVEAHLAPCNAAEVGVFAVMIVVVDLFSVFVAHVSALCGGTGGADSDRREER